ncbi:hypothetical protein A1O3_08483 [Capronia epimyces CBS 606.96]|uniref:Inner kinetochore subunit AME1 domain-containing protein n=1 Tax=Capronia epimyces CBS 606.96 TaxID=1182542 RepID=W9XFJ2_9EURO|nr:uncharacterized protein A1O3_08483 [Capronia epimyces CBS 606.96]EXJ78983.1 hypothetical protein A1O3_08483 [Capronia epimyces CBS 606.96]
MNILALEHDVDDGRDADGKGSQENTEGLESGNRTRPKLDESSLHVLNTAGPSSQNKRKKRKSVVLGRKKKRSSGPRETEVAPADMPAQNSEVLGPSEAELISSSLPPGQRRTRSSFEVKAPGEGEGSPNSHRARSPKEIEEDDDGTYIQESSPEPQTPAATKRASKVPHYRTNPNRDTRAAGTKGSKPTFPILTHRLTNVSYLPTIHEASDDESRFENAMDIPNDRSQPNVVDVLSQICRETIENLVQDMSENVQPSERAALKNKRNALEEFGRDLNDELFELSEAVENRINLEARLRKSKRDKASLQTEWLELRKEREQIALRCDDVRRRHWEFEEQARERWDLSEAARRAELELERDDQPNEDGLEFLLRSVVSSVSSASEAGGLLDKVRSFNSQLERMAAVLEGRVRD